MTIDERLASLERDRRLNRAIIYALAATLLAFMGLGMMQPGQTPEVVRAKRFDVVGEDGKTLVRLGSRSGEGGQSGRLRIYGANGKESVIVGSNDLGGAVLVMNDDEREVVSMRSDQKGGSVGVMHDDGRTAAILGVNPEGIPGLFVINSKEQVVVYLVADKGDYGRLAISNKEGKAVAFLRGSAPTGAGVLDIHNGKGQSVATISANSQNGGFFTIDADERAVVQLEDRMGIGRLSILTRDGKEVALVGRSENGGIVYVANNDGGEVVGLAVQKDGSGACEVKNSQGESTAVLATDATGDGAVIIRTSSGKEVGTFTVSDEGGGILNVLDSQGHRVIVIASGAAEGMPLIQCLNNRGTPVAFIGVDSNGLSALGLGDGTTVRVMRMSDMPAN